MLVLSPGVVIPSVPASEIRSDWRLRRAVATIGVDDVHLWRLQLDQAEPLVAWLAEMLSDDERERAARAATAAAGRHFVVARAALRTVLASYLRVEPRALAFAYGSRGKP